MHIRQKILDEARTWMDIPFRHQGRTRHNGIDCVGLVIKVAEEFNLLGGFDVKNYRREPDQYKFLDHFKEQMVLKPIKDRKPGDVLLMRDNVFTCHSVFYDVVDGQEKIIHAYALRRKVVEEDLTQEWKDNITHCFAYKGVDA